MTRSRLIAAIVMTALSIGVVSCSSGTDTGGTSVATSEESDTVSSSTPRTVVPSSSSPGSAPSTSASAAVTASGSATTVASSNAIDKGLRPYIDLAVTDLAGRLAIESSAITTRSAAITVWPDASLGCPKPGMQYAQVQTDGAKIVLVANGETYSYHSGGSKPPFLCEQPSRSAPTTTTGA